MPELSAYEGIPLVYGTTTVVLRPSLRAATRLERLHGGFPELLRKIEEFDTQTVRHVITYSAGMQASDRLFACAATQPLSSFMQTTQPALMALVNALLPEPPEDQPKAENTGKPMPWAEVYRELFGLATGWLGWPPATAWDATPQEITDAFHAHLAKLKAIHGSADDIEDTDEPATVSDTYTPERLAKIAEQGHDPAFDRTGLHGLRQKGKL